MMRVSTLKASTALTPGKIYAMADTATVKLNTAGEGNAKTLISTGHYNTDAAWSFSAADGDALLGAGGDNWDNYAKWHLGEDTGAAEKTKARYKYPYGKGGKVYKRALDAIDSRATQADDKAIDEAANRLKDQIAKKEGGGDSKSWFKVKAAIKSAEVNGNPVPPQILVYDEIGGFGVGVDDFNRALKSLGPDCKEIDMRMNSPGGDSFAGVAIHNILAAHPATITCYIDGIAASAASLIAMAADKIIAPENTFMAIHNPYAMTIGPATAHRSMADDLDRVSDSYATTYANRSKQPIDAVKALMGEDRLMGAKEAKSLGYVDELVPPKLMAASFDLSKLPDKWRGISASVYQPKDAAAEAAAAETERLRIAALATAEQARLAAAGTAAVVYGMVEIDETLSLCTIARAPAALANRFIGDKTPVAKVREQLAAIAASAGDAAAILAVDVTTANVGVQDVQAAPQLDSRGVAIPDEAILARKREVQKRIKAETGGKVSTAA